ncbi:hypothetical protein [Nocardioides sp. R-C-SC26]|uniref:hypothetical protein n=1 Tax=Nocardioides sp. R-C-SC26 TaxID=2870414 RepID=UPI001E2CE3FB|nr:hypothetical protein [Nocardioides sp. R-C-SC26]
MARRPRRLDQLAAVPELVLGVIGLGCIALARWLSNGEDPNDLERAVLIVGDEHGMRP